MGTELAFEKSTIVARVAVYEVHATVKGSQINPSSSIQM